MRPSIAQRGVVGYSFLLELEAKVGVNGQIQGVEPTCKEVRQRREGGERVDIQTSLIEGRPPNLLEDCALDEGTQDTR
jgi:hypothetical protein